MIFASIVGMVQLYSDSATCAASQRNNSIVLIFSRATQQLLFVLMKQCSVLVTSDARELGFESINGQFVEHICLCT